jgi:HEAT repeat protein
MPDLRALLSDLTSGDDQRAKRASAEIVQRGETALPALQACFIGGNPDAQWWVICTLASIPSPAIIPFLEAGLASSLPALQQSALLACRLQPFPDLVPAILPLLGAPDKLTARLAGDALIAQGNAAVPPVLARVESADKLPPSEAIRALAKIQDERAVPTFYRLLEAPSPLLQHWAEIGLENLGVGMVFFKPD